MMHSDDVIAAPIILGSSKMVSVNTFLTEIEKIAGVKMNRKYELNTAQGMARRKSDNTLINR